MDSNEYKIIKKIVDKTDDILDLKMMINYIEARIQNIKEKDNDKKVK